MHLPNGVYVVSSSFQGKEGAVSFCFKGTEYHAQMGINAFYRMEDVIRGQLETASESFCGYCGTPILLFPAGVFEAGIQYPDTARTERFCYYLPQAVTVLGENAGISPNAADLRTPNPQWGTESVFAGSYFYGSLGIMGEIPGTLTIDGMVIQTSKICDDRTGGNDPRLVIKNCIFRDLASRDQVVQEPLADPAASRHTLLSNVRIDGMDARGRERILIDLQCGSLTVENLYFGNTDMFPGLTNYLQNAPCGRQGEKAILAYRNCLFENCTAPGGMGICFPEDSEMTLRLERCTFDRIAPKGTSPISVVVPNEKCRVEITDCTITGEDSVPAVMLSGCADAALVCENTTAPGYAGFAAWKAPRRTEITKDIPLTDPHTPLAPDMAQLDALYGGMAAYHGDYHTHTNSGGISDGKTLLAEFPQQLKALHMDFAAVVDHRQMRHFFQPEWDETMLICGTEPGTRLVGRPERSADLHYCLTYPDKEGLAKTMAEHPEFEYTGGIEGTMRNASFTPESLTAFGEYVYGIGGLLAHAHPKQMIASSDPLDYYFGDRVAIETVHGAVSGYDTRMNRDLWVSLLQLGKRVRTYGSTDTHAAARCDGQTTLYAPNRHSRDFFAAVRSGNCTAGAVGIQMAIGTTPMGGETAYKPGMKLSVRIGDYHPSWKENAVYRLNVFTDQGLAYAEEFTGKARLQLTLPVEKRRFYRVEITNESDGHTAALGNPIWLD